MVSGYLGFTHGFNINVIQIKLALVQVISEHEPRLNRNPQLYQQGAWSSGPSYLHCPFHLK